MTAVWILLFVCTSSLPSCSQGDVSVANQSYASSEECYADGGRQPKVTEVAGYNEAAANFAFVEPEREYGPAPFGRHSACTICFARDELEAA
jgi:hypothetical protein